MTTREENLKRINDELEMMSDDELDKVAGGAHLPGGAIYLMANPKTDNSPENSQFGLEKYEKHNYVVIL